MKYLYFGIKCTKGQNNLDGCDALCLPVELLDSCRSLQQLLCSFGNLAMLFKMLRLFFMKRKA